MTIDTLEILKLLNKMTDYAGVAYFGAMKEGFLKAVNEMAGFISAYEEHEGKNIAKELDK